MRRAGAQGLCETDTNAFHPFLQATYGEFYVTNIFGSKMVEVVEDHDPKRGPLFLYASFTAPHQPLQALLEDFANCDPEVSKNVEGLSDD